MHKLTPSEASQLTVHEQRYAAQHIKSRGRNQGKLFIALDKVSNTSCSVELFVEHMRAWKKKKKRFWCFESSSNSYMSVDEYPSTFVSHASSGVVLANRLAALKGG